MHSRAGGLFNLANTETITGAAGSMNLRQESLLQLMLKADKFSHWIKGALALKHPGRLDPTIIHASNCLGRIPIREASEFELEVDRFFEKVQISPTAIQVSREEILHAGWIPQNLTIGAFEGIEMTPLMYALYKRRYAVVCAILATENTTLITETSRTPISAIIAIPGGMNSSGPYLPFGPIHVATWTYICYNTYSSDGHDINLVQLFSILCQNTHNFAGALDFAVKTRNRGLLAVLEGITSNKGYLQLFGCPRNDLAAQILASMNLYGELWCREDWEFILPTPLGKELQKANTGLKFIFWDSQKEFGDEGKRDFGINGNGLEGLNQKGNDDANIDDSHFSQINKRPEGVGGFKNRKGYNGEYQRKRQKGNDQNNDYKDQTQSKRLAPGLLDTNTPDSHTATTDEPASSSKKGMLRHPTHIMTTSAIQQRSSKGTYGSKPNHGLSIMSLASKAPASTASSGVSVISLGGMPFIRPRGKVFNTEKTQLSEEPEPMVIDSMY
ncbi:hypothetical protein TWF481_011503 [Arthrobotrys musiformis]|uniref:Uncharacterized protein n=1 Tax=Arthrobotrys musiformis TaxID=47236 RepID=A0AAV9VZY5_9PEZI